MSGRRIVKVNIIPTILIHEMLKIVRKETSDISAGTLGVAVSIKPKRYIGRKIRWLRIIPREEW